MSGSMSDCDKAFEEWYLDLYKDGPKIAIEGHYKKHNWEGRLAFKAAWEIQEKKIQELLTIKKDIAEMTAEFLDSVHKVDEEIVNAYNEWVKDTTT